MLEHILPADVAVAATREEILGEPLYPEEEQVVARAVESRQREFVSARACARRALAQMGVAAQAIPPGQRGEPLWPPGIVGSITHCTGYRACALALDADFAAVGIDAEIDEPLPSGLLADVALPEERDWVRALGREMPGLNWDRLLFSIKESVYKVWYPLAHSWLGFEDATVAIDPHSGGFTAELLVPGPRLGGEVLKGLEGRWLARDGLLLAAIALPAETATTVGATLSSQAGR